MKTKLALLALILGTTLQAEPGGTTSVTVPPPAGTTTTLLPRVNVTVQGWAVGDNSPRAATAGQSSLLRLRRAEIKVSGRVSSLGRYFVMLDPSRYIPPGDNRVLQDIGVGLNLTEELEAVVGQFKTLASSEGTVSSAELLFPERSILARRFGERRDVGVQLNYKTRALRVSAMLSDARSTGKASKDLSFRLDVPLAAGLETGMFAHFGDLDYNQRGRWGLNVTYKPSTFSVRTEFAMGRDNGVVSAASSIEGGYKVSDKLEAIARYELGKRNVAAADIGHVEGLGFNYYLAKNQAKLQTALLLLQGVAGRAGTYDLDPTSRGAIVVASFQAAI